MLAIGIAIGAIIALVIHISARARVRASDEFVTQMRTERDNALAEARDARAAAGEDRESSITELNEARRAADAELSKTREQLMGVQSELATTKTELRKEREAHGERLREKEAELERLDERVKAALQEALTGSNEQLLQLANAQSAEQRAEAKREFAEERRKIDKKVEDLQQALKALGGTITKIENDRIEGREALAAEVRLLRESQKETLAGTQALVGALHRPEVRGRWGEIQFRNLVEKAGMLPHVDFTEQVSVEGHDGVLRPDACVHMPGNRDVIVDTKVPLDALLAASAETDPEKRDALLGEHGQQLRAHLNKLDSKSYWDALDCVPDFVVMFVPSDEVVLAAMRVDRKLAQDVHEKRVVIASPMNLMALLRVIALGWRQEKLAENAEEVVTLGKQVFKNLGIFARRFKAVGKKLAALQKGWNDAVASFDRTLLPVSRRFAELGVVPEDQEIERAQAIPFAPREIEGRGLPELVAGDDEEAAVGGPGIEEAA
jgi:DNA recombination protein RmuC